MIPASYFYKDLYVRNWGDPRDPRPEPVDDEPRGSGRNQLTGLAGMLAAVLPMHIGTRRRIRHG